MMKSVALSQMIAVWGPVATILGALFEIGLEEGTIQAAGHKKGRKIGGCAKKCKKTGLFMDILALLGSDI